MALNFIKSMLIIVVASIISLYLCEAILYLRNAIPFYVEGLPLKPFTEKLLEYNDNQPDGNLEGFQIYYHLLSKGERVYVYTRGPSPGNKNRFAGTLSNSKIILCQNTVYQSDEHGFNNPMGLWKKGGVDMVIIGDSQVHGWCVRPGMDMASQVRLASGKNALNLGSAGNEVMGNFVTLREFGPPIEPKIVVWGHFEWDINYLYELKYKNYRKYLQDDNYTQNWFLRQNEIDTAYLNYEPSVRKTASTMADPKSSPQLRAFIRLWNDEPVKKFFTFNGLRNLLHLFQPQDDILKTDVMPQFEYMMKKSKELVSKWNGRLVFVFFPTPERFGDQWDKRRFWKSDVLDYMKSIGVQTIDFEELFQKQGDPLSFYAARRGPHFNAHGNKFIGETLSKLFTQEAKEAQTTRQ